MAAFLIRACFKQRSTKTWLDIIKTESYAIKNKNVSPKVCIGCHCYHTTPIYFKRRKTKEEKLKKIVEPVIVKKKNQLPVVGIWKNMTVRELSESLDRPINDVLQAISYSDSYNKYDKNTIIENKNIIFDAVKRLGAKYKLVSKPDENKNNNNLSSSINLSALHDAVKRPLPNNNDDSIILIKRHPVVTVMGHVDHGKTTLLDTLRHTSVVASEFGGITQHIGAFNVSMESGEKITFLDTPGHAAFSSMRARGANSTDIVILVVAADDGVMEQTVQSIKMAKEANVPIIVAVNKIDKHEANIVVSGIAWAKVRAMFDHAGNPVSEASLADAVQIIGWRELPMAGDEIIEVEDERRAHIVMHYRQSVRAKSKESEIAEYVKKQQEEHDIEYHKQLNEKRALGRRRSLPKGPRKKEIIEDENAVPRLNVIIKGDVLGSVEAILDVFDTYGDENRCRLDVVHYGIGVVSESDIELADAFNAIIYTFNTSTPRKVADMADKIGVVISSQRVIYKLIDDVKEQICKKLSPEKVEEIIGKANVLQHFEITDRKKKVNVAGCRCIMGVLKKTALFRLIRQEEIIYEGKLSSMKHLKDDVMTIKTGIDCGLQFEDPSVFVEPGDTLVCYTIHDVPPTVKWDPGF
ncbi:hypothetical protein HCN44_008887 [Aphidius gifuensis]|uniref:Tr-type G domain-containing protein n=1 Tax=Aphidius gifuensis TaxID=684658 RepID=A0A834XVE8_APHGI|nr:hypothetical protein HCN44_008887 [Aphidius gifuensis]